MKLFKKLDLKCLAILLVFFVLLLFLLVYLMFFVARRDIGKVSVGLRDSIVSLTVVDEHFLDSYESMLYAPNFVKYNTCSGDTEVISDEWPWARDWIFLLVFDSLNAEMSNNLKLKENTIPLMDSLYAQYTDPEGYLEFYTLWGLESYCAPYLFLSDHGESLPYTETLDLAKKLCLDFYNIEYYESLCDKDGYCIDDEGFYSTLEKLFQEGHNLDLDYDDFSYFEEFNENKYYPVHSITDDFIVGYTQNSELTVQTANMNLLNGIDYQKYFVDFMSDINEAQPCVDNSDYHFGLLKALAVKKRQITDPSLRAKHEFIENQMLNLCSPYYSNVEEVVLYHSAVGNRLELAGFFKDDLDENFVENLIAKSLEDDLVSRRINGRQYSFLNPTILGSTGDDCYDVEIDLAKNLKTSLYMLISTIDED